MACLRDIKNLFGPSHNPFYAGFGNRLTDALSYRSVNIPSTRIFTINSYAEVSVDLLTLTKYKSSYVSMRDLVDHFFPPVTLLNSDEQFTDFNYWRDAIPDPSEFSDSDDEEDDRKKSVTGMIRGRSHRGVDDEEDDEEEDEEYEEGEEAMGESYMTGMSGNYTDGQGEEVYEEYSGDEEEEYDDEEEEEGEEDGDDELDGEHIEAMRTEDTIQPQVVDEPAQEASGLSVSGAVQEKLAGPGMLDDVNRSLISRAVDSVEKEIAGIIEDVSERFSNLTHTGPESEKQGLEVEVGKTGDAAAAATDEVKKEISVAMQLV